MLTVEPPPRSFRRALRTVAVCLCAVGVTGLQAGEKIRFTDKPGEQQAVKDPRKRIEDSALGGFLERGNSLSGFAAPTAPGVTLPGGASRLKNRSDDRKNWLINSTEEGGVTQRRAEEALGVRPEFSLDGRDAKTEDSTTGDRWNPEADSGRTDRKEDGERKPVDERTTPRTGPEALPSENSRSFERADGSRAYEPRSPFEMDTRTSERFSVYASPFERDAMPVSLAPGLTGSRGLAGARDLPLNREAPFKDRADAFKALLNSGMGTAPLANTLGGIADPVNDQADSTRKDLNPVLPSNPLRPPGMSGPTGKDFSQTFNPVPASARPSFDPSPLPSLLGGSSLSPLSLVPQPPKAAAPNTILNFPRRGF